MAIFIGALNDKVTGGRPSQVLVHHPVRGPHRAIKLEPMDHVVIDPDAGDSYCGDDQKNAAQNGDDDFTSSHTNLTESGKQEALEYLAGWVDHRPFRLKAPMTLASRFSRSSIRIVGTRV